MCCATFLRLSDVDEWQTGKSEEIVAVTVARRWLIAHMHQGSPRVIPDRSRKGLE